MALSQMARAGYEHRRHDSFLGLPAAGVFHTQILGLCTFAAAIDELCRLNSEHVTPGLATCALNRRIPSAVIGHSVSLFANALSGAADVPLYLTSSMVAAIPFADGNRVKSTHQPTLPHGAGVASSRSEYHVRRRSPLGALNDEHGARCAPRPQDAPPVSTYAIAMQLCALLPRVRVVSLVEARQRPNKAALRALHAIPDMTRHIGGLFSKLRGAH